MCPVRYRDAGRALMDWDLYTATVDRLPAMRELHVQGLGEPLLHPRFFDMVAYAADKGIEVSVNTNLTILTASMARRMADCGLAAIYVSIDAADPAVYEYIRVGARFDRVDRNLQRLIDAIGGRERPRLALVVVAMRCNLTQLSEVVRLAARRGVAAVNVQHLCHDYGESTLPVRYAPMRDFFEAETLLGYDPVAVDRAFRGASAAAVECGVQLRLPPTAGREHAPDTPGRERCDWPWRGPYIAYDGTVMPCCVAATPERAHLARLNGEPFETIWNGPAYTAFRNALSSAAPPEICRTCSIYRHTF
jgi:radical SAM protein with 4Fe4S-binding SPASM domain